MANNQDHHQKSSDFHQHVPTKNTEDPLAKYHQQLRSLGKNQPSASRRRDQKKKMAMDRAHAEETTDKHHTPGPDLEPSGKEKERPTNEHLEKRPGGGTPSRPAAPGESWSESPRTADAGGLLWMAYVPPGAQGPSK